MSARLSENAKVLLDAYGTIAESTGSGRTLSPAAEWLLDNFHVVEEQIREIKTDLPPRFYYQLPKNAEGHLKGYPRVFGLAWAFVAHTDSRFELQTLIRFVNAYQRVQPLTIGELWAIAITLRITLVENLRRLAVVIVHNREASQEADAMADLLLGDSGKEPESPAAVLSDYADAELMPAFAAQLDHRLRDQEASLTPVLNWLADRLATQGTTLDQIVQNELRLQGALNVSVRNIITSMRLISDTDWAEFFESVSMVDAALRAESEFEAMDFATRNLYRRAIERLARGSRLSELEVAQRAIALAKRPETRSRDGKLSGREREPGYYLIAGGAKLFERELKYRPPPSEWLGRFNTATGCVGYLVTIAIVTTLIAALPLYELAWLADWPFLCLTILSLLPASDGAVALVNRAVTHRVGPAILPGMELAGGVPSHLRTLVAMPVLLVDEQQVQELIEHLEVHHLASADGDLYFALLTDWTDAKSETVPGDDDLLSVAEEGIAALNRRYGLGAAGERFLLLHRHRVWNKRERKWMGWERKRGKLHELNRLLRGATDTTFIEIAGKAPTVPPDVRFVTTIDADTRLPREAVKSLIGKMAHPLNRPELDSKTALVVEGHAILQPRVTPSLPIGREGSLFQRIFSAPRGLDPYAFAVSDVYQDLFQEGSYTGKGIYDVDAFEAALAGRIPENSVLSHDLLEGCFARAGLVSDIEVVEEFPSRYDVASARQHRWVRGDWQLLPWILGIGRDPNGRKRNVINLISRWKMFDNLRRSLSAPATLLALIYGWTLPVKAAAIWTLFIVATMVVPSLLPWIAGLIPHQRGISKRSHLRGLASDLAIASIQFGFLITFLAHQAWLMLDAAGRTLFRLLRRRRLLEWVTAAQVSSASRDQWKEHVFRALIVSISFAVAVLLIVGRSGSGALGIALPFLVAWAASPGIAWWASRSPPTVGHIPISEEDTLELRRVARRTWRFFETFVTADDHFLPPDNFQEDPKPAVARRTSPTNLGLYLLAVLTAREFGWIGTLEAAERLERTLGSMSALERFRGHFYNWYATDDLRPLHPRYISTVDSGNLAGHLIALARACRRMSEEPACAPHRLAGIRDNFVLAYEALDTLEIRLGTPAASVKRLRTSLEEIRAALPSLISGTQSPEPHLSGLAATADAASAIAHSLAHESGVAAAQEVRLWVDALSASVRSHLRDLETGGRALIGRELSPNGTAPGAAFAAASVAGGGGALLRARAEVPEEDGETLVREQPRRDVRSAVASATSNETENTLTSRLNAIAALAESFFSVMKFDFLYEARRQLFAIGFRVEDSELDPNCYDLLASEARLASFIAIAREEAPPKHWFRLGRTLTPVGHGSALISWSGSMFEYLMPSLVMRAPAGSLLDQTNRLAVQRQISFGRETGTPWGISESLFNARDIEGTYQYSGFGVADLGYKRGLGQNIVIAPYATALAAMIAPHSAAENFRRMSEEGGCGAFGYYEALDYTPERVPEGAKVGIVRAYMAHHQAMSIVGIANALLEGEMRQYFHAEPIIQATELLLQERMPRDITVARPPAQRVRSVGEAEQAVPEILRRYNSPHSRIPRTHILSNGSYAVMLTGAGSGYSRWRNLDMTRWREDVTCDNWGSYIFLRDTRSGDVWSAGYQPTGIEPERYQVAFSEGRAEFTREDGALRTMLEVAVSPEYDGEVRRVTLTNIGGRTREIELTSYAELVLAPHAEDAAHPAFSKLFIQTEFVPGAGTLLATRRRKSPDQPEVWAAHLAVVQGESDGSIQFETDRARFLGRGHSVRSPLSVAEGWPLSNTTGSVLDPILSLRCRVRIPRGETVRVSFWTVVAPTREEVLDLADRHREPTAFDRLTTMAWTQAQGQFHHLGIGPEEAHLFQRLATRIVFSDPTLRPPPETLKRGGRNVSALWAHGISGDLPIVLLRIDRTEDLNIVRQLLRAFEYWRLKRLAVDLVIMNDRASSYLQDLQGAIDHLVRPIQARPKAEGDDVRGSVFVLRSDLIPQETTLLLQTIARVVLFSRRGTLSEQVNRIEEPRLPVIAPPRAPVPISSYADVPRARPALEFFNGLGGFAAEGREYVTILERGHLTPAPWINVVANDCFGFQVSADGAGFTWALNSQQNRLSPWSNDPVCDPAGEAIYLRDQDSGELWTPTASPIREESASYISRHGQGYSRFEVNAHGMGLDLVQFVPLDDPVKISRLKITNNSRRRRNLSLTAYVEWVLGATRSESAPYVVTEIDPETGAMFARNPLSNDFGTRISFADLDGRQNSWTGDRAEFLGRNGTVQGPVALLRGTPLSNRTGAGFDPCSALQTTLDLKPGATIEMVFFLGQAGDPVEAQHLIAKYRTSNLDAVFSEVARFWDDTLSKIEVKTPDRSLDLLINRWLLYQTLACRVWARSGFYQSSGAYGFRDQLQDVCALLATRPQIARSHLIRAASRQFAEGDVQHWWLPETGRGVRTRVSDDRVWLAYVAAHYVTTTGDGSVLDENVTFIEGPPLREDEYDAFFQPTIAKQSATLFEHCARALDGALVTGAHGLPLMGAGDWNDGMNRVGEGGKGESVWLGWFLYSALMNFAPFAQDRDPARATRWRDYAAKLHKALAEAWDGDWYRRAYFDDGTPLGSVANTECRIDSIAQSWSVISGAGELHCSARAMAAVEKYLVRRDDGLVLLFTPPFDKASPNPGYIKGYPPGIRENGGQYTHAALWTVLAFAMMGDGDKAYDVLSLLNPIHHAGNSAAIHRYRVEPYVVCADIYSAPPHVGRGGWTWYTGSAGWMYRVAVESVLGLRLEGSSLVVDPCIPRSWPRFDARLRHGGSLYEITVENPNRVGHGVLAADLDGKRIDGRAARVTLVDDGATHRLRVTLG